MEYIKIENINDLNSLSNLVLNSFDKFVAPDYSKEGVKTFYGFFDQGKLLEKTLENGDSIFIAKENNQVTGLLATRNKRHISLLFVDENHQKKGIGKKLFHILCETIEENKITVNSSPFAEKIYEKLGFIKLSPIQEKDGIKFIPMEFLKK